MADSKSILNSVKQRLGYPVELTDFDADIIAAINGSIASLTRIGVGPQTGFAITSDEETYEDFVGTDIQNLSMVEMYVLVKTKLAFDPPSTSYLINVLEDQAKEYEFSLQVHSEFPEI